MEVVAAFGLAGTVLQFIDSGAKFVTLARSFYKQGTDDTGTDSHLVLITKSLNAILPILLNSENDHGTKHGLTQLATDCSEAAARLMRILESIRDPRFLRKRDAVKAAFRRMCKEEEIQSLQEQLSSFRDQLNLHLLLSLRQYASKSATQQEEIVAKLGAVQRSNLQVGGIAETILDYLASKENGPFEQGLSEEEAQRNRANEIGSLKHALVRTLYESDISEGGDSAVHIRLSQADLETTVGIVLTSLHFENMVDRESRIVTAHESTFCWVFQNLEAQEQESKSPRWSNLRQWLESDDQLYWITGKAGSGKSTLMKFLCSQEADIPRIDGTNESNHGHREDRYRCQPFLEKWADPLDLVVASFYFWNSGMELQVTQNGLFRTLLHQLFVQHPKILPQVLSSKHFEALCLFNQFRGYWSTGDLRVMLLKAIKVLADGHKICLFVDGLDEFSDNPEILVDLVQDITSQNKHVKMCVASRPWNVFQDALGKQPSLRLEELTFDDTKRYVRSKFQRNRDFETLRQRYRSFADNLIDNIVRKAAGVFLWVDLVVASLLAGMQRGDRIHDFQKRLDELPPDLEELYDKILHSLDPFYLEHAVQYFTLIESAEKPMTLLQCAFADEETPASALNMAHGQMTLSDIQVRVEALARRLNSRCKGLIETDRALHSIQEADTRRPEHLTVQYLHRTVKDFIKSPKAQSFLQASIKSDFDPSTQLCLAYLMDLKYRQSHETRETFHAGVRDPAEASQAEIVFQCMRNAAFAQRKNQPAIIELLDHLRDIVGHSDISKSLATSFATPTSRQDFRTYLKGRLQREPDRTYMASDAIDASFLSLAVMYNVTAYVKARVEHGALVVPPTEGRWPLLMDALSVEVPNPEMVRSLLEVDADPNFKVSDIDSQTPWVVALTKASLLYTIQNESKSSEEYLQAEAKWKETLKLMYSWGAHRADIPEARLTPISRRLLLEIKSETLPKKNPDSSNWLGLSSLSIWGSNSHA
ncbi:hypothetical protein LTR10_011580 [Elasticomyces elasticus]|uniref:NACHT domain-containing protein n=1 Tax=Exophiala sideris TaxID=1016849 RepID=A0ABR0JDN0_9EURO|nr:hypothetical protein LTR10_011580 [Elasticomyces elasticus]KAK5031961.1 hypothetical protein LTS07_004582 [Exophiala sideris]KAK5040890.1 hypothetical protein LTR13_003191 [Exophiala sideris]KAK5061775.1 hypothetical protein LTR69_004958 [Exophiala sideris]KAK5184475.1 hypothetical protein LTR44_003149 [Eurotiomycetes sp. CCFEE 6388]